ncbi:hypothetical protein GCM10027055_03860 [Janibacter alkaliphilus]|uniref:ESAT-6-like protein n=1 Tax=Janibacter alkaliphilus TaxID=1069963 RepID=A0A852XEW1_9MICO|nr:WXG100 family type VII secretion target [Janibacter alkaliphilus]NYG37001.1 WXG100 family type VII secretion target [Janibacter alkaliphilus]
MGSTFAVSTDRLASSSTDTARISEEVESTVAAMMSRLISLQDEWTGSASGSFQDLVTEWRATQRQVKDSLDTIARVLGEAGEAYRETEDGVRASMGGR